ncbi:hypothetical protein BO71DRAFT_56248 [Aspergillus ellipticus CBS 707.79]|uniref:Uncharacterized protein n=1 Tax=Aspergillus ellipticus CBS 707.79 TaxID=1448320 RepID=A0A319EJN7_9EURO|nr:hypothetical protein BO71DRAFT_56248 [Aspergillus ellipticus CBS 707.79]
MPFIVSTSTQKVDPRTRKLIRSHVMIGKNRGKSRLDGSADADGAGERPPRLLLPPVVPRRVGNDMSLIRVADETTSAAALSLIFRFADNARVGFNPLAACIVFNKANKNWMVDMLGWNAAYVNAMVVTTQSYFHVLGGLDTPVSPHLGRTLGLLRDRLADEQVQLSNETIIVVTLLILQAQITGDLIAVRLHTEGVRKMVHLRGGLGAFMSNSKLAINLIRSDIGLALFSGGKAAFFDNQDMGNFIPPPFCLKISPLANPPFVRDLNPQLAGIWRITQGFSTQMNLASTTNGRISEPDFVRSMVSVLYPLQHMDFENGSCDEAIRLALLGYRFDIFLRWRNVLFSFPYLSVAYERCWMDLRKRDDVPPQLWVWLLTIGGLSVFVPPT